MIVVGLVERQGFVAGCAGGVPEYILCGEGNYLKYGGDVGHCIPQIRSADWNPKSPSRIPKFPVSATQSCLWPVTPEQSMWWTSSRQDASSWKAHSPLLIRPPSLSCPTSSEGQFADPNPRVRIPSRSCETLGLNTASGTVSTRQR